MNLQDLRNAIADMLAEVKHQPDSDWRGNYGAFTAVWLPTVPGQSYRLFGLRVIRIYSHPQVTTLTDLGAKICAALEELGKPAGQGYSCMEGVNCIEVVPD